jgi:hypothetical protein
MPDYLGPVLDQIQQGARLHLQLAQAAAQQQQLEDAKQQRQMEYALRSRELDQQQQNADRAHQEWATMTLTNLLQNGAKPVNPGGTTTEPMALGPGVIGAQGQTTEVPATPGQQVSVDGRGFYVPTQDESFAKALDQEGQKQKAIQAAKPAFDVDPSAFPNFKISGPITSDDAEKLSKAQSDLKEGAPLPPYKVFYTTDDAGNGHVVVVNPSTQEVHTTRVNGVGKRTKAAGEGARVSAAQLRMVTQKKADGLQKAEEEFRKTIGVPGVQPSDVEAAKQRLLQDKQATQNAYEEELGNLGLPVKHFDYSSQGAPPAAPQTKAPGAPSPSGSKGRGKLTDTKTALDYLNRAGGDRANARQLARADGWEF